MGWYLIIPCQIAHQEVEGHLYKHLPNAMLTPLWFPNLGKTLVVFFSLFFELCTFQFIPSCVIQPCIKLFQRENPSQKKQIFYICMHVLLTEDNTGITTFSPVEPCNDTTDASYKFMGKFTSALMADNEHWW